MFAGHVKTWELFHKLAHITRLVCASHVLHSTKSIVLLFTVPNKLKLFEMGIADGAIKHLKSKSPVVQFKALGTLRLMSDKQGTASVFDVIRSVMLLLYVESY